jgi:large subunit ribosomal protein L17
MKHGIAGNKLSRNSTLRKATMRDIAIATLIRQRITTTQAIAKEGRKLVDQLITMGKKNTLSEKRRAFSVLCDHKLVSDLFEKIAPRFNSRSGGYTRIIRLGQRRGDNASLVLLELTEKQEIIKKPKASEKISKKSKVIDIEAQPEVKADDAKADASKSTTKKHLPTGDKGSKVKPKVGMIKKMFQRKVGES